MIVQESVPHAWPVDNDLRSEATDWMRASSRLGKSSLFVTCRSAQPVGAQTMASGDRVPR